MHVGIEAKYTSNIYTRLALKPTYTRTPFTEQHEDLMPPLYIIGLQTFSDRHSLTSYNVYLSITKIFS